MKACGRIVGKVAVIEKKKGTRTFYKISFLLKEGDGEEFQCYFWADQKTNISLVEGKEIFLKIKKVVNNELFIEVLQPDNEEIMTVPHSTISIIRRS